MNRTESVRIEELYKTPSIRVIDLRGEAIICASTEGYGLNPNGLREDDWE